MTGLRPGLLLAAGLAIATPALAQDLTVEVLNRGEYVAERGGEPDADLKSDTLSGVSSIAQPRFTRPGTQIEGRYCGSFGVMFRVRGIPLGETAVLTVRMSHPRMVRPDGVAGTDDTYEVRVTQAPSWVGFTFAESWSLVPGPWIITLSQGGRDLAQQGFDVRRAEDPGTLAANCAAAIS